jgi:hypothetical protein
MAIIKSAFEIEGSIRGVSFYKRNGSDKIIMRTKGGASKQKIRNSPKFEKLRQQQTEWAGCVIMSRSICTALYDVIRLADYNISAGMNGFAKRLQGLDKDNPAGKRRIQLSAYKYLLEGFQLNKTHTFAGILQVIPTWTIHRETPEAYVEIPYINTDIHLVNPYNFPWFRIITCLGFVSDMHRDTETKEYLINNELVNGIEFVERTVWYSGNSVIEAQKLILKPDINQIANLTDDVSLVLSIGVEFGKAGLDDMPVEVKHAGGAMILGVR